MALQGNLIVRDSFFFLYFPFRLILVFTHFPISQLANNCLSESEESCYTEKSIELKKWMGCIFHNYVFTGLIDLLSS